MHNNVWMVLGSVVKENAWFFCFLDNCKVFLRVTSDCAHMEDFKMNLFQMCWKEHVNGITHSLPRTAMEEMAKCSTENGCGAWHSSFLKTNCLDPHWLLCSLNMWWHTIFHFKNDTVQRLCHQSSRFWWIVSLSWKSCWKVHTHSKQSHSNDDFPHCEIHSQKFCLDLLFPFEISVCMNLFLVTFFTCQLFSKQFESLISTETRKWLVVQKTQLWWMTSPSFTANSVKCRQNVWCQQWFNTVKLSAWQLTDQQAPSLAIQLKKTEVQVSPRLDEWDFGKRNFDGLAWAAQPSNLQPIWFTPQFQFWTSFVLDIFCGVTPSHKSKQWGCLTVTQSIQCGQCSHWCSSSEN